MKIPPKCPSCNTEAIFGIEVDHKLIGFFCDSCNFRFIQKGKEDEYQAVIDEIKAACSEVGKTIGATKRWAKT